MASNLAVYSCPWQFGKHFTAWLAHRNFTNMKRIKYFCTKYYYFKVIVFFRLTKYSVYTNDPITRNHASVSCQSNLAFRQLIFCTAKGGGGGILLGFTKIFFHKILSCSFFPYILARLSRGYCFIS